MLRAPGHPRLTHPNDRQQLPEHALDATPTNLGRPGHHRSGTQLVTGC